MASTKKIQSQWTADDVCKLLDHARKVGVSEFALDGLQFKLSEGTGPLPLAPENPELTKTIIRNEAINIKLQQADEMLVTDPTAYEEMVEKILHSPDAILPEQRAI